MRKPKPYKCSICGVEVPDLPMLVLQHQISHVGRRPYSGSVPKPAVRNETGGKHQITGSSRDD
jgi:hypothetical protein